jgi:nucleotide-binding universal stress UspA family protein
VPPGWTGAYRREAQEAAKDAVARFEAAAKRAGVSAQATWSSAGLNGGLELFARIARRFDLSIVRQAQTGKSDAATPFIEAALFETGRAVLVVPHTRKAGIKLDRVMIAWDGSRSAARALGDAMPFLRRAKAVQLVMVTEHGKSEEVPGADIARHLACHQLAAEIKEIVAPHIKAADVLLSHATETGADLLVLGGYGHSRLREFVLGGVTRSVLAATTVPALMSH